MSIADKLTLLINTKQDIKSAISEKGVEITGGMTTYADAIRRIETGGGGGGGDSIYVPVGLKFGYNYRKDPVSQPKFTLPKLILADGHIDCSYMFDGNNGLTSINGIYSSNSSLTACESMFRNCESLTSIPQLQLNTSFVIVCKYMFQNCKSLTTIPLFNTSRVEYMNSMFEGCTSLTTIPLLNTSKVSNMTEMFKGCTSLTTIPQLDTSGVFLADYMFYDCWNLKSLPLLNALNLVSSDRLFGTNNPDISTPYPRLTDLGGFKDVNHNLYGLDGMPNLTVQSLMNVINNLYDFVGNGSTTTKTLTLGTTNLNKLTAEQKAVATNKGWVLA